MSFNEGFSTQGVPYVTGSADGQLLTWDSASQSWVSGDGLGTVITTVSTSNGIIGDGTSGNTVRLDSSISVENLTVTNTASIYHLDTIYQDSLVVGDKYITILSGANTHASADGSGFLWGSGSTDGTTGILDSVASITYASSSDSLKVFPNLEVDDKLNVTGDTTISGSLNVLDGVSGSFSGSFIGDGSKIINIPSSAVDLSGYAKLSATSNNFAGSLTSSVGFVGRLYDTASYSLDADKLDGFDSSEFARLNNTASFTQITGTVGITSPYISSSHFIGDASDLVNLPTSVDRVLYVASGSVNSLQNGSLTDPFLTIQAAINYASSSYTNFSQSVIVEVAPGKYAENLSISRPNTYIKSHLNKTDQRAIELNGNIVIDCPTATQKYNHVVGFEGMFVNNSNVNPTVRISGTGSFLTYFKNSYLASANASSSVIKLDSTRTFDNTKLTIRHTTINSQRAGSDALSIAGGDVKLDSIELFCSTTAAGTTNAISASGDTIISADRLLVEMSSPVTGSALINNSSRKTSYPTDYVSLAAFNPTVYLTNSTLSALGSGISGSTIYTARNTFLWNVIIGAGNRKIQGFNPGYSASLQYITYGNITIDSTLTTSSVSSSHLKEYHGDIIGNTVTASSGFSGRLYGTASYATSASYATTSSYSNTASYATTSSYAENAGNLNLYARKDLSNTFTNTNTFQSESQFRKQVSLIDADLVLYGLGPTSGDIQVAGGDIINTDGNIAVEGLGYFIGSANGPAGETGIFNITSSNWRDGGIVGEQQFKDDIRGLLSGSSTILYDKTTGVIQSVMNPSDYVTQIDATASLAFTHDTNTFTEPQIISASSSPNPILTLVQTASTNQTALKINGAGLGNLADFSHPSGSFKVNLSGNVGIRSNFYTDSTNHPSNPFTLTVENTIVQSNTTKGIVQFGSPGPMILRDPGTGETFDRGNSYEPFGKYGMWSFADELVFTVPYLNTGIYYPQYKWFKFKNADRNGPSTEILSIRNDGETNLHGTLSVDGYSSFGANVDIAGDVTGNSFTGSFSGSAIGIKDLTGSMWTGTNSFAKDVRAQLNAGTGINYDPINGTIVWTGVGGTGGLLSTGSITGSGKFGEEFRLKNDISVVSVTGRLYGTADYANDSALLNGSSSADFAQLGAPNNIFAGDISADTITANVEFSGPGTGLTLLTGSNWHNLEAGFIADVRAQLSGTYPIAYDVNSGEITYRGTIPGDLYVSSRLTGSGISANPLDLAENITLTSVTARLYGTADNALQASIATTATNSLKLNNLLPSQYARRDDTNTFSENNTFTGNRNSFTNDVGISGDLTASHFAGDGFSITNITASHITNWYNDIYGALREGPGIILNKIGNYTYITASSGGGGGGYTTGSIEGTGIIGDETRLKPVINITGAVTDYIDFNTSATPSANILGRVQYDSTSETLKYNFGDSSTVNLGQQSVIKVYNDSGATISKGKLVSLLNNFSAGVPTVELSDMSGSDSARNCVGVALTNILDNDSGYIVTNGIVYEINTSAYAAGTTLYLDNSGSFTDVKPSTPDNFVTIGTVVESGIVGSIFLKIQNGYSLDELHDVNISAKTQGDLLFWDDTNSYWSNSSNITGTYNIDGAITASYGFSSSAGVISPLNVLYSETSSYTRDPGAARTAVSNRFIATNTFQGQTIFSGAVIFKNTLSLDGVTNFNGALTASEARFTGDEVVFDHDIRVNGTASVALLNTINQNSLQIGDKYITILSGASDHISLDQSGILWGSGSTGPTIGPNGENAYIRFIDSTDQLEIFPGLRVSGSLTSSNGLTVTGSIQSTSDITGSSVSASYYYGSGVNLTNVNAVSSTNNIITVTTSSVYPGSPVAAIGNLVSFSGSLFCLADNTDDRRSNFVGVITSINGNTYTVATTGIVSASAVTSFVGGDIAYIDGAGKITNYAGISSGQYITQVGIASYDVGTSGNIILQPRIFGIKA